MIGEFGIITQPCYFCEHEQLVHFHEHYYFCPECSVIYTFLMIQETNCEHMVKDTQTIPCINNRPWYKEARNKLFIYSEFGQQFCSVCDAFVTADGW